MAIPDPGMPPVAEPNRTYRPEQARQEPEEPREREPEEKEETPPTRPPEEGGRGTYIDVYV